LVASLKELLDAGEVDSMQHAAIARAWAAWSLGGVGETHILRVAHLVTRAHTAIHQASAEQTMEAAIEACASVLHIGLPSAIRQRMPFERTVLVVRELQRQPDQWSGVVEGTAELLGWKDYARVHAASVLRAVIEQARSGQTDSKK
jgi:hypothetical protein